MQAANQSGDFPMSQAQRRAYRLGRRLMGGICKSYLRLKVEGAANIPSAGGFILAPAGHRSYLDTPVVTQASDRVLRFMGANSFFEKPVLGSFLRAMGGFPVDRDASDRQALGLAEQVLSQGEPLVMFPEGARFSGAEVLPIKPGIAFIAARAQVPIVPVGIGGLEQIMGKGRLWIRPGRCSLVIGEPMLPPTKEGSRVKRSAVQTYSEEVQLNLQSVFDEASSLVD